MPKLRREHTVIVCAIAGVLLVDLLINSTQARSSDCPGYQLGDLNRWAEQQGRRLRPPDKPAYYDMPTSVAPQAQVKPQVRAQLPATVAEGQGLSEEQWAAKHNKPTSASAGQKLSPPVADAYDTSAHDRLIDEGVVEVATQDLCSSVPVGMQCRVAGQTPPARSGKGGENVAL